MKALEGLKVLDLTSALNGPFCTTMLADHGAEVIKLSRRQENSAEPGDPLMRKAEKADLCFFKQNKKGCTLNLKNEKAGKCFMSWSKTPMRWWKIIVRV